MILELLVPLPYEILNDLFDINIIKYDDLNTTMLQMYSVLWLHTQTSPYNVSSESTDTDMVCQKVICLQPQ